MNGAGQGTDAAEAFYSIIGIRGLKDRSLAVEFGDKLIKGMTSSQVTELPGYTADLEVMEGIYLENKLDQAAILPLERTPVGRVTAPVLEEGRWAIYLVQGKKRGDLPTFDSVYREVKGAAEQEYVKKTNEDLMRRGAAQYPADFLADERLIEEMVGEWMDARKAISGISPSTGAFHKQ